MAAGARARVEVRGLRELVKSFNDMPDEVSEEILWELEESARPVEQAAQVKALTALRNMPHSPEWAAMRVGISRRQALVWVAPQLRGERRKTSSRQKDVFTSRVQSRALDPALDENAEKVVERVEDMLDRIGRKEGF